MAMKVRNFFENIYRFLDRHSALTSELESRRINEELSSPFTQRERRQNRTSG